MKKLLMLSLLLAGMLSVFSCSDNNEPFEELPAPTEVTTTAEAATKAKKVYDYVHVTDGYYNLADEMTEFEMKSQKYGTCWLHAAAASMETAYFKENGSYISIDPMKLLDFTYLNKKDEGFFVKEGLDEKELGGSQWIVILSLSNGFGDLALDSSVILDKNDREAIKENIRKRGGVAIGILDSDDRKKGWFGTYRTINYTKDDDFDHDVTIIGYDDHFPKEYFKEPASEDGAWITYNSSLGSACYYYISYCAPLEYAISHSATDKYGEVLSYDAGNESDRYVKTGDSTKTANVFHKAGKLAAVGTYNDFDEQDIKIEIYNEGFTELLYSQDAKLDYHGYHTIDLDTPVDVTDYAIVITYTKGAPVEGEDADYGEIKYKTVSEKDRSFIYIDNNWKDMTDSDIKTVLKTDFSPNNCCIKAIYAK
ncbi:lectin like domain-containing protein [Ruminococcus flavefaciens]|uniref:lectin like domain-containing protein n=1 Tax=Ruminococcus flavefaciens TaxID=1265 RepID=UPI0026F2399F|nr:lectin like domain-containing protein [Ruminococcus flavefaciens]